MGVAAMRVPTVFTAVDKFSSVVSKMTMSVSAFGKTAEAAAMRTSRTLNSAGTAMLGAGVGMAVGLGLAVNEAMKFEKAMANISTLTKDTPEQMKSIGDSILNMSTKIPVALSDLTVGMYDTVSAGIEGTAHQLDVLDKSGRLAVAGLGTTKEAVNITTSALNAFGKEAGTAYEVTNLLMKSVKYGKTTVSGISESFGTFAAIMKNSGVTLKEYLASTTALTTAGMTMSTAQTQVSSATMALVKPNNQMLKVYKQLGVKDVPAFIKANGGLVNTLDLVGKKGKSMGLMLSKVFGRKEGLSAYLSLMGALAPKFKEIMTDMSGGTDLLNTAFAKQQETFSAQFQIMKNKIVGLGIAIGNELMPRISGFINTISPMVSGLITWIKNNEWLATSLLSITVGLLALGALAKVGAILFYGYAQAIRIYIFVTKTASLISGFFSLGLEGMATAATFATASLLETISTVLLFVAPILVVIAALGLLAYTMYKSGQTTKAFAQNNTTHLRIVSGEYETMEERIAKANDRIVANMKKFKLDLESVKNTGKTIAELDHDKSSAVVKAHSKLAIIDAISKSNSSNISKNVKVPGDFALHKTWESNTDKAFNDIMAEHTPKNLSGTNDSNSTKSSNGGIFTINVNDPNKTLSPFEPQKMVGVGGIPIILTYNGGQR